MFLLALSAIVLLYVTLWGFVGRFPAESMQVSRDDARSVHSLCYDRSDTRDVIAIADPSRRGSSALALPIERRPTSSGQLGQISGSRALFYSVFDNKIYIINRLDPDDVTHLNDLAFWGILDRTDVARVIASAPSFSPPCLAPVTDQGVTESYWATKGTSVLHHWAFLFDAAVSDGKPVHAQYGFLVSRIASALSRSLEPGPTGFVRVAWVVFCCIGVAYGLAFVFVFRRNMAIAVAGLAWQIALFASVGSFSLLLSPGYHWSRELVMVFPALFLSALDKRGERPRRFSYIILALGLAIVSATLDPTFTFVSLGCLALALITFYWGSIGQFARARRAPFVAVAVLAVVVLLAVAVADGSNFIYIVSKTVDFLSAALADSSRNVNLAVNVLIAITIVALCAYRRLAVTAAYYGYISIVSFQYFVITPDQFHWAKYQEFVVPIYVVFGTATYSWLARARVLARFKHFADAAILVVACFLLTDSYRSVTKQPPNWELRIVDSVGAPYFASVPVVINGRMIDANINQDTIHTLETFPASPAADLIVSPLDKYILFLYDEHNGFPVIDETAWMDTDTKIQDMETYALRRHVTVLVDRQVFEVNPTAGLLSTDPVMGSENSQSLLSVKSKIRMSEFAAFITRRCTPLGPVPSPWKKYRC